MEKKSLSLELEKLEHNILLVTLNRPKASNAFDTRMAEEIIKLFEQLINKENNNRVVILTGSGEKSFCAGGDLKERQSMSDIEWELQHKVFERMIRSVLACPIPIIASVNGAAYGGGCELAAAADFIYAANTAVFAQTETRLGIIPGAGGTQNLTRAVGERRAKEIIYTGYPFSAKEGMEWGLVNAVYPLDSLMSKTITTAEQISKNAPIAIRQAKLAIHRGMQMSLSEGLAFEIEAYNKTIKTNDRLEGVNAFNQNRTPNFNGN